MVDSEHVIIVGHTRYAAIRKLGWKQVPVVISDLPPEKAKEYRVIDNRAGEYATWDRNLLLPELREFTDDATLALFFPEIDLSIDVARFDLLDDEDMERASERLAARFEDPDMPPITVTCPNCGKTFVVTD